MVLCVESWLADAVAAMKKLSGMMVFSFMVLVFIDMSDHRLSQKYD